MKNILITGGAGFIGSNLSLQLVGKGYDVTVLDNLSEQIHGRQPEVTSPSYKAIVHKVKFIKGDVRSKDDWERALGGQDIVVHLAAETGMGQSMYKIKDYVDVNVSGTGLMLDLLVNNKRHQVKKVIVASSRAIYGEGKYQHPQKGVVYPAQRLERDMIKGDFDVKCGDNKQLTLLPTDEEAMIRPTTIYGVTKQNQEQMVQLTCSSVGIHSVVLRYQNVFGPRQSLLNPYTGILSIFSTQIRNGHEINVFEDGCESRDFIYIDDAVAATIAGIEKEEANGEVFNVGTGVNTNVLSVAQYLIKSYNKEVPVKVSGHFRIGDIRHNMADITKIKTKLGFQPKFSFKKGVYQFTKWVLSEEVKADNLLTSLEEMKSKGLYK